MSQVHCDISLCNNPSRDCQVDSKQLKIKFDNSEQHTYSLRIFKFRCSINSPLYKVSTVSNGVFTQKLNDSVKNPTNKIVQMVWCYIMTNTYNKECYDYCFPKIIHNCNLLPPPLVNHVELIDNEPNTRKTVKRR